MIGLNTSIFKSAGRKLVNLLGALKDRATYYENGTDSVAEKNHIDDLGVLDKATILLTPTAYSDALVHSVKTYTGDELVTGETSKSVNTGGVYTDILTDINATLGQKLQVTYTLTGIEGDIQLWNYTNYTRIYSPTHSTDGTYTATIDITGNNSSLDLRFYSPSGRTGTISNISVVDVSSDFDFDRASSATRINSSGLVQDMQSITDPELVLNGDFEELGDELITNGSLDTNSGWTFVNGPTYNSNGYIDFNLVGGNARTDINVVQDKVYKVVYEIKNYQEGTIKFRLQGGTNTGGQQQSGNGIKTEYVTCNDSSNNNFQFFGSSSFIGSVDNVSVKQVDPNDRWTLFGEAELDCS